MFDRRAFKAEFLLHARATSGWPPEASVKSWCQEKDRGFEFMANGQYAPVAAGDFVDERHVWLVVNYLLHPAHRNFPERRSLNLFLQEHGVASPEAATAAQVLDLVSVVERIPDEGFGRGTSVMLKFFERLFRPSDHMRLIKREQEVREAMGWMCVEGGRQLANGRLPEFEALAKDEARMGPSLKEYQDRAVEWWTENPWTIVHTIGNHQITGMCMALPVTETFYNRARGGKCRTYDCRKEDLKMTSAYVIVEGLAPKMDLRANKISPGESFIRAILCQQAGVSDVPGVCSPGRPLRLLSFASTPVGKRRLKGFGYKGLSTFFPGTDIEYMERELVLSPLRLTDAPIVGIWWGLQLLLRKVYGDRLRSDDPLAGSSPETR
jgi:hypothetical protein